MDSPVWNAYTGSVSPPLPSRIQPSQPHEQGDDSSVAPPPLDVIPSADHQASEAARKKKRTKTSKIEEDAGLLPASIPEGGVLKKKKKKKKASYALAEGERGVGSGSGSGSLSSHISLGSRRSDHSRTSWESAPRTPLSRDLDAGGLPGVIEHGTNPYSGVMDNPDHYQRDICTR